MPSAALAQFEQFLASGDYYSAHQKARTATTRLLAPPRRGPAPTPAADGSLVFDSKAQEAAELLWEGSRRLLEKGQIGSGVDLAQLLLDVWKTRGVKCDDDTRAKVIQLIALTGPSGSWRKQLTDTIFAWSAKTGSGEAGDVQIHTYLGELLYKEKDFHQASYHLLLSPTADGSRLLSSVLFEWANLDPEGKTCLGRYAARGTLSYLESTAILAARTFLSHFLSLALTKFPELLVVKFSFPPVGSPLQKLATEKNSEEIIVTKLASLNWLQLVVKDCQIGAGESVEKVKGENGVSRDVKGGGRKVWQNLNQRYERELKWLKSPELKESTQELGTIFFGIKPPRPAGNPMMDMLAGMFGGGGGGAPQIGSR